MKKKLVGMTFGPGGIHIPGTKALPILKPGEIGLVKYHADGKSVITKKKPIPLQVTHIFDRRAARLFKNKLKPVLKEFFDQVPPHRQKQLLIEKKIPKKGYFIPEYQRQEREIVNKSIADAKKFLQEGIGWGTSKRRYKKGHPGFERAGIGTWDFIQPVPNGYILIQKKHLDEVAWALGLASTIFCQSMSIHATVANLKRMQQALKNISVK